MVTLITANETAVLTGYHRIYIRTLMRKGDFPAGIYVPQERTRATLHFRKAEVEAWLAKRAAEKAAKRRAQS